MSETNDGGYERGLKDAIDVVHAEGRWQWELDHRRSVGAQIVAQRMGVVESILAGMLQRAQEAHNRPESDAQPTDGSLEVRR